ncbi:MAG: DUF2190 family protein [Proteobacteria bacterium]|nr:DUF2190 family protein [Pseudomonadota bacterium]
MLNSICEGDSLTYLNETGAEIASGSPVLVGATLGVACGIIADDTEGVLAIEGVYELPKATGAIGQGALVYWDADGNPVVGATQTGALTTTDSGNTLAGRAYAAAASGDATVQIKLNA